jgi:hypothetical protein
VDVRLVRPMKKQIVVRVDDALHAALQADAEANGRTVAQSVRFHLRHILPDSTRSATDRYERLWASRGGRTTHLFHPGPGTLDAALCGVLLRAEAWGRQLPTENDPECGRCNAPTRPRPATPSWRDR